MTIDTSREAVEQINEELSWDDSFGAIELINALLAERDAALAEVARLSTPPDDAEVAALVAEVRKLAWSGRDDTADAITRLSQALAAETAKREAMEIKAAKLWMLLDDIDTQDDASREDNLHFRDATRRHQKRRFSILHENEAEELLKKGDGK